MGLPFIVVYVSGRRIDSRSTVLWQVTETQNGCTEKVYLDKVPKKRKVLEVQAVIRYTFMYLF